MTERRANLAALLVALGGGLLLGAIAVFPMRNLSVVTYAHRMTALRIAFWIGVAGSLLAALGFVFRFVRGWPPPRFVAGVGAIGIASIVFQIGLFSRWSPMVFFILLCIAGLMLIAQRLAVEGASVLISIVLFFWIVMATWFTPKLVIALQYRRQRETLFNVVRVRNAVEEYGEVNKIYPPAQNVAELARLLEPRYIPVLPKTDGWGFPLEYRRVILNTGVQGYVIRSAGCDGIFEHKDATAYTEAFVNGFERDVVTSTVSKSQWPEGFMAP